MQGKKTTANSDRFEIDQIAKLFFAIFTNINLKQPDWTIIDNICIPETIIIKKTKDAEIVYDLKSFIEPRRTILTDGTIIDFEEIETNEETDISGNIAQRFSRYQKSGYFNGNYFQEYGNKFFQFVKTHKGWKISSMIWEDDEH